MINNLQIIWVVFTFSFLILCIFHLKQAHSEIEKFKNKGQIKNINGLSPGVIEFIEDFNKYIDKQNSDNKKINYAQAFGYLLAAITSIISFLIT